MYIILVYGQIDCVEDKKVRCDCKNDRFVVLQNTNEGLHAAKTDRIRNHSQE